MGINSKTTVKSTNLDDNLDLLLKQAEQVFKNNFPQETCFERAVFYSWYCKIRDCQYCYMSTQKDSPMARRSVESLIAEVILCKHFGWKIGFFSGGIGAFSEEELLVVLKKLYNVTHEKFWLNLGALTKKQLELFAPYAEGVVGSIEVINPLLHKTICPSKPISPYEKMFDEAKKLGLKNAMTIIIGLGEKKEDYILLKDFIEKHNIQKIHFYGLNPQKGTVFENSNPPSMEDQAWWIAKTRIDFPKIDIQMGIWLDRVDRISYLLKAGANSVSKFPVIRYFGTDKAVAISDQAKLAGREFKSNILTIPENFNWEAEVNKLDLSDKEKQIVFKKLTSYLKKMARHSLSKDDDCLE